MANQSRRVAIKNLVAGTAALGTANMLSSFTTPGEIKSTALKGNINHAVCRWCYSSIELEDLCIAVKK
jgi:hydroxypyruvate isomerase